MTTPRRMRREDRRASFLHVAATIVEEGGAGALTLDALADRAGVAPSLPYAYFDSKEELLLLLFDEVIGGLDEQVEAVLVGGAGFDEVVRRSLEVWFVAAQDHGRLVGALLGGASIPGLRAAVARRDEASHQRWHDVVMERFDLGDPAAHLFAAMLNRCATATIELSLSGRGSQEALVEAFVAMALGAAAGLRRSS